MNPETEQSRQKRSREAERSVEIEKNKEDEVNSELKAAAAMERAEYLVKEVKQTKQQMQNIVLHMQEVLRAIRELRDALQLAEDTQDPVSVERDKEHVELLKQKIQGYQGELIKMRHDLVREQIEIVKNGVGVGLSSAELEQRAEEMVDAMIGQRNKGFSLLEVIIGLGIFVIFAVGIYSSIQFAAKIVYQSQIRIVETSILNEQIEIVRNMAFADVGIVNGSPAGLLERIVTTTVNGIDFVVTRTVRNVDDPFDGTVTTTPQDLSPADYKLVEVSVTCAVCKQKNPLAMDSLIAPKYLEGDPDNGALFIEVLDSEGKPVQDAEVHVVATSTSPTFDFVDTTNNQGLLTLVDLPAGQGAYHITVTKAGFTTDKTTASSESISNPLTPPLSVVAQNVTEKTFIIDTISAIDLVAMNNLCEPIENVSITLRGTNQLWGTEPDVLIVSSTISTDGDGAYNFSSLPWDTYEMETANYDIAGTAPALPLVLSPGVTQPVQFIANVNTPHSLLMIVRDSVTTQPISSATVHVTSTLGFDQTQITGVGHIRQTDWSLGAGQAFMDNPSRYATDDGGVEENNPAGDITLKELDGMYVGSGVLESSTFDLGVEANYINLLWEPQAQPPDTGPSSLLFQLASSNTSTAEIWDYTGPDGTASTYYDITTPAIHAASHNGNRYVRYKAYLSTDTVSTTPTLSDTTISYTNSCTPPGQVFFSNMNESDYSVQVTAPGYQDYTSSVSVEGNRMFLVEMMST